MWPVLSFWSAPWTGYVDFIQHLFLCAVTWPFLPGAQGRFKGQLAKEMESFGNTNCDMNSSYFRGKQEKTLLCLPTTPLYK